MTLDTKSHNRKDSSTHLEGIILETEQKVKKNVSRRCTIVEQTDHLLTLLTRLTPSNSINHELRNDIYCYGH